MIVTDKQTLILAGEAVPQRYAAAASSSSAPVAEPRLTIVATPADDTLLLAQGESTPRTWMAAASVQNKLVRGSYGSSPRSASLRAANEYALTQDLPAGGARTSFIDTYA